MNQGEEGRPSLREVWELAGQLQTAMAAMDEVMTVSETFDELLRRQLDQNLLTQERAAEITGVSVSSMKRYCRGAGVPSTYNAAQIASAFGLEARQVAEAIRNSDSNGNGIQDERDGQDDNDDGVK